MGNELGWGSDKSSKNRFGGSWDLSRASPKFISHEHRKKDTHSLTKPDQDKCSEVSINSLLLYTSIS